MTAPYVADSAVDVTTSHRKVVNGASLQRFCQYDNVDIGINASSCASVSKIQEH